MSEEKMVISKTPVRVGLFGGGTDYREYFEKKSGAYQRPLKGIIL